MRMSGLAKYGLTAAAIGAASIYGAWLGACDADEHRRSTPPPEGCVTQGTCTTCPGSFPSAPDCDPSKNSCDTSSTNCKIDTAKCGDLSCLPMANNTGTTLDFRIRRLNMAAPASLTYGTNNIIQTAVMNSSIDLNANACGEEGKGTFTWLLRVDKANKKLTTGGAPPADPFTTGYCFYNHEVTVGTANINVQPVTVDIDPAQSTDTTFSTTAADKLNVPIFLDTVGSSVIILPLSSPRFKDVTIGPGNNCIGALNPNALDTTCQDVFDTCSKWKTAGSIAGFITLEDADTVLVKDLNQTLCVVLTRAAPATKCARDGSGQIIAKGDFCSTTKAPGDCKDSFWIAATFAASAVKINDGSTTPACQGGAAPLDAGTDAEAADGGADATGDGEVDAGSDAAADAPDAD